MKTIACQIGSVLPLRLRTTVKPESWDGLCQLRLRLGQPPLLEYTDRTGMLDGEVTAGELRFCVNAASRYSPWSAAGMREGFLTLPGGHRMGLCGSWNGSGFTELSSLCIRVARDVRGIAAGIGLSGPVLILGPPGSGKTTLLRDLIRRAGTNSSVAVVDGRGELFPEEALSWRCAGVDVLHGCGKEAGITMVLRSMGPGWIAVDEITAAADCDALVQAGWCGVKLLATAHAADVSDLMTRPVYAPLVRTGLFHNIVVLRRDRTWYMERV